MISQDKQNKAPRKFGALFFYTKIAKSSRLSFGEVYLLSHSPLEIFTTFILNLVLPSHAKNHLFPTFDDLFYPN